MHPPDEDEDGWIEARWAEIEDAFAMTDGALERGSPGALLSPQQGQGQALALKGRRHPALLHESPCQPLQSEASCISAANPEAQP